MLKKKSKILLIVILLIASFLRLWRLNEIPVSLFGDELDVGYHAYSILKTGKDYSGNPWPLHFQSLAEWRTPLYLYSCVPTIAAFGISPLGVRLPAAIFGICGVLGVYLLVKELFRFRKRGKQVQEDKIALLAASVLAFSPWHVQYSRAAFEVTELLVFLIFGQYFFFKALRKNGYLWVSVMFLVFMPWIYSTAKLFTPLLILFSILVWRKELFKFPKKEVIKAILVGLLVGLPITYSTLYGGGSERFSYISVFTDPTRETEVGYQRQFDADFKGEIQLGLKPTIQTKFFHNKLTFWAKKITDNYLKAFSTDFLFISGDPNPRHSIIGMGQFYKIEFIALLSGIIFLFYSKLDKKVKCLILFWILLAPLASSITRDGGNHATRLILVLPPLVFLIAFGLVSTFDRITGKKRILLTTCYISLYLLSFAFYQHQLWVHNPWDSERWWHAGWKDAIQSIKKLEGNHDKVIISMAGEPAWIFFAAWYEYLPDIWHKDFPVGNDVELEGFGKISHIDKFYFGSPKDLALYDWGKVIDASILYLANGKEVGINLIKEPGRTPTNLRLIKSIPYPSGEPAFYLFTGASHESNSI